MTASICERTQRDSSICAWLGNRTALATAFIVDSPLSSVLHGCPQPIGPRILQICSRGYWDTCRSGGRNDRVVADILDPCPDAPRAGVIRQSGVELVVGHLLGPQIVHVIGPPLALIPPVDVCAHCRVTQRDIVGIAGLDDP